MRLADWLILPLLITILTLQAYMLFVLLEKYLRPISVPLADLDQHRCRELGYSCSGFSQARRARLTISIPSSLLIALAISTITLAKDNISASQDTSRQAGCQARKAY
ncbi:hypothetical protein JB92DRAFT_2908982 [Gautieria morchelliformis]|nr:hypothetical protein JB92DRAFT_2908982 [Gautieria morchelliformis]